MTACRELDDPDVMFPSRDDRFGNALAKQVCTRCPVLVECGEYAISHGIVHGVWGGLSENERRREVRRRGGHLHGLLEGYVNHRCRCDLCVQAGSAYYSDRRRPLVTA